MAKIYDQKINKHQNWGGDSSTGNLPVSGRSVQEFIKEQLEGRFGTIYYDSANNRYMVFADEENRTLYLDNPVVNSKLLLGTFIAPSEYSAIITLTSPVNSNIFLGQKNNYIEFTFDITNKSSSSTGEGVICNYTIINGNNKKVVTERYKYGTLVRFNVDDYLKEGVNRITVNVIGETSLAGTSVGVTYNMIDLVLTDTFNIAKENLSSGSLEIPYYVSGAGTKKLEWFLDGVKLAEEENDVIVQTSTNRIKFLPYSQLSHGNHTLQFRAFVDMNGEKFYTKTHFKSFIVSASLLTPVIGYSCLLPTNTIIGPDQPCTVSGVIQYEAYQITYAVYDPRGMSSNVLITHNGTNLSNVVVQNGDSIVFPFRSVSYGAQNLIISVGAISQTIKFNISKSPYNIEEITNSLTLDLRAIGRSNSDPNKDKWTYGNISTTFTGFKWNNLSGWNGKELMIRSGSKIVINHKPLAVNPKINGATIEFVFTTENVINRNTVLISSKNTDGTGINVTAEEVLLRSLNGITVNTFYKSQEKIRVSFVIHRSDDNYNQTMFVYINGIISSVNTYDSNDSFISDSLITIGAQGGLADIKLGSVRAYSRALSPEEILNNFMLYQDDAAQMLTLYDKNNIYEEGSYTISVDKLAAKLPVMIFTGDVPVLLATGSSSTKITLSEIEYINLQNPEFSFKGNNVELRPQGTSSMGYPIKNFRFYLATGTVYNNRGEKITTTKIKSNSIPVSTFCLKADYAESSGTHNTGVARMWNDLYYNVNINGQFVCRTNAQKAAIANKYEYDVRTAIDGYPIVVFYRLTKDSPLVFLGQYNYNNDKSTENVFGFKDIPTFDNKDVACWEHLNNGHPIGLFTDISKFFTQNAISKQPEWTEAFEARFPKSPTTDQIQKLYDFASWISSTKTDLAKFKTEKAQHLDLYKMAAYYVYVIRFGAVDQVVKNAMLTTEDGIHYYYIHYDNDTINGLRNDGLRIYSYDIDRTTLDPTSQERQHAYAGKESVLWNNLEADPEFMALVATMDHALYEAGMSYRNVIDMFDNKQMSKWSERVYNENQKVKYLRPFYDQKINKLFMAQGSRQQHRRYWLSNRFSLYDGIFVSGEYLARFIEIKAPDTQTNTPFTIMSGMDKGYFGYGINKLIKASKIILNKDQSHTFTTPSDQILNIGDPVRIYAPHFVKKLDLSALQPTMTSLAVDKVNHEELGSRLEELILGSASGVNAGMDFISGIEKAINLKKLDVRGFSAIKSLNLESLDQLEELLASRSGLKGVIFAKAAPIKKLELPPQNTLHLDSLLLLTNANLIITDNGASCREVSFRNCPMINTQTWVFNWIGIKTTPANQSTLTLSGINWTISFAQLQQLKSAVGTLNITGRINITDAATQTIVDWISSNFGSGVFNPNNSLIITVPSGMFITGPSTVKIGESAVYSVAMFPVIEGDYPVYSLNSTTYATITQEGILTVHGIFDGNSSVTLEVYSKLNPSNRITKSITLAGYTYPTSVTINSKTTYGLGLHQIPCTLTPANFTGSLTYEWTLTGVDSSLAVIESASTATCSLRVKIMPSASTQATIQLKVYKTGTSIIKAQSSATIYIMDPDTIATRGTNSYLCDFMYAKGYSTDQNRVTKADALKIVGEFPKGLSTAMKSFDEFQYFTNVTSIAYGAFKSLGISSIEIPSSVTVFGEACFDSCSSLTSITIPSGVTSLGSRSFAGCGALTSITIPSGVTTLPVSCFNSCTSLTSITIPSNITRIEIWCFDLCSSLTSITIPSSVTFLGDGFIGRCRSLISVEIEANITTLPQECFRENTALESVTLPLSLTEIKGLCFSQCTSLKSLTIPKNVSKIGSSSFRECSALVISVDPENPNYSSYSGGLYNKEQTTLIAIGAVPQSFAPTLTAIGYSCFSYCTSLTSITIPSGVTSLGSSCFQNCSALTSITLPSGLTSLGDWCFQNCSKLASITIPSGVTSLGINCFEFCGALTSITLPSVVTSLGSNCFKYCSALTSITLPSGLTSLGSSCFEYCSALTSITIPSGVTSLGDWCFNGCSSLTSIIIQSGIKTINDYCFTGCSSLTSITIPSSVTSLGGSCFQNCSKLASITLPSGLIYISVSCFKYCSALTSITIPSSVTSLGSNCFFGCINMNSIYIPDRIAPPTVDTTSFGIDASSWTGRNNYAAGTNKLYVYSNSAGFNNGVWYNTLCNANACGFTLSKTL